MPEPAALTSLVYLRPPSVPGTELLLAENSTRIWRMFHDRYLICGCTTVATVWIYRGKSCFMSDGGTAFFEPGETHRVTATLRPSSFRALFIEPAILVERAREYGCPVTPHFRTAQVADLGILNLLYRFSVSVEDNESALEQQSRFSILLAAAFTFLENRPRPFFGARIDRSLQSAKDLVHEKFAEQITLDELATAASMSRYHLVRRFTRQFGLPPHAYQNQLRIRRACALLRDRRPLTEAAAFVGFADQSHFARHFKKVMGVTPGVYGRAMILRSKPLASTAP